MPYIKRTDLLEAIVTVNAVSGTQTIFRTVENQLINRFSDPIDIIDDTRLDREFNIVDQFRNDVAELVEMLEMNGSYYSADKRRYYRFARDIAQELIDSGISWASETKVREAQRVKRGTN